jgi:hypothetical protein
VTIPHSSLELSPAPGGAFSVGPMSEPRQGHVGALGLTTFTGGVLGGMFATSSLRGFHQYFQNNIQAIGYCPKSERSVLI